MTMEDDDGGYVPTWNVTIFLQERGSKRDTQRFITFETRDQAIEALSKLEADITKASEREHIVLDSGAERLSFIAQDYRGSKLDEQ